MGVCANGSIETVNINQYAKIWYQGLGEIYHSHVSRKTIWPVIKIYMAQEPKILVKKLGKFVHHNVTGLSTELIQYQ